MSDSFDFERNNIETDGGKEPPKEPENTDNQSLLALKSSTTMPSVCDTQDLTNSQLMNSSRSTIYKSLMEKSALDQGKDACSTMQQSEAAGESVASAHTTSSKEPKITPKSNVFDFNNWTYLLDTNDSQSSSSKDPKTLMDEFYDICRDEYGLK